MKNIFFTLIVLSLSFTMIAQAQEFDKHMASAKSAYTSGNLEDARFNLENALREIDAAIGREILKELPTSLGGLTSDTKNDQVTGMSGSIVGGLYVHRVYGNTQVKGITLDIISDSPLMAGLNAILAMPMVMNTGDANQKVVKVQGYKSLLNRKADAENKTSGYSLQIPFTNSMLTLDYAGAISEADFLKIANSLPLEKIVKLAQ
jgi:hypothetical protein